jgi:4-carboxymuconolactone decarboxylase
MGPTLEHCSMLRPPRSPSLVTVAALVAGYRTNKLPFHPGRALENGVTRDELVEVITHLAFYAG